MSNDIFPGAYRGDPTIFNEERPCSVCGRTVDVAPEIPDDQVLCREHYFELAE